MSQGADVLNFHLDVKLRENKGYLLNYNQKSVVRTNVDRLPPTRQRDQKRENFQAGLKETGCLLH